MRYKVQEGSDASQWSLMMESIDEGTAINAARDYAMCDDTDMDIRAYDSQEDKVLALWKSAYEPVKIDVIGKSNWLETIKDNYGMTEEHMKELCDRWLYFYNMRKENETL